jgi:predicted metal-dependent hydrolase
MTKSRISYSKLNLNEKEIAYRLKRSKRARYLRLQINPSTGLEVILPYRCKIEEAERFIYKKREWIFKHLSTVKLKEEFSYFGQKIEVQQRFNLFITKHKISFSKHILNAESPAGSLETLENIYNVWLKHLAKKYLTERIEKLARKYNFIFKQVRIRNQKTRWGSCSTKGSISLNYKLMRYRKEVIDYVIIHELCHLKEMNHSKKFWKLVEEIIPDYKNLKKELRTNSI